MSYIPSELVRLRQKFQHRKTSFHQLLSRVEYECQTVAESLNNKDKWKRAISLRKFLDGILDASEIDLSEKQRERVKGQMNKLNKAVLESKSSEF